MTQFGENALAVLANMPKTVEDVTFAKELDQRNIGWRKKLSAIKSGNGPSSATIFIREHKTKRGSRRMRTTRVIFIKHKFTAIYGDRGVICG